jgi:hypothetical protein
MPDVFGAAHLPPLPAADYCANLPLSLTPVGRSTEHGSLFLRFGQLLSIIVCVYLAGGHWAVLQTAAWTGMLADYGRSHGLEKAVSMTFDGAHPCAMCRKIEVAKKGESAPGLPGGKSDQSTKRDPVIPDDKHLALLDPAFALIRLQTHDREGETRRGIPLLPPPRNTVA